MCRSYLPLRCLSGSQNTVVSLNALRHGVAGGEPFIQRVEIQAWSLTIDYKPRRLDVAALRQGAFLEARREPCLPACLVG